VTDTPHLLRYKPQNVVFIKKFLENLKSYELHCHKFTQDRSSWECNFPLSLRQFVSANVFFEVASHRTSRFSSHQSALFLEESMLKCRPANRLSLIVLFSLVLPGSCWDSMVHFHFLLINHIIIWALYTGVSFMVSLSPDAWCDDPAFEGFLYDEAAVLWDTMKGLCTILETGKVSSKSESSNALFLYCIRN
jgi:hypothetical protein